MAYIKIANDPCVAMLHEPYILDTTSVHQKGFTPYKLITNPATLRASARSIHAY